MALIQLHKLGARRLRPRKEPRVDLRPVGKNLGRKVVNFQVLRDRQTIGPIRNVFATSHVTVNLLLSATSQNLYEWGLLSLKRTT